MKTVLVFGIFLFWFSIRLGFVYKYSAVCTLLSIQHSIHHENNFKELFFTLKLLFVNCNVTTLHSLLTVKSVYDYSLSLFLKEQETI